MGLVCDGLTANRKFFNLHVPEAKELVHSVPNPYTSEERPFLFFSDPPHLIKTVRNAWENKRRYLQVFDGSKFMFSINFDRSMGNSFPGHI